MYFGAGSPLDYHSVAYGYVQISLGEYISMPCLLPINRCQHHTYLSIQPGSTMLPHITKALTLVGLLLVTRVSSDCTEASIIHIACCKFHLNNTAEQEGGRTSAFLNLYAKHPELLVPPPRGERPLNTPLDLNNVKRDKE